MTDCDVEGVFLVAEEKRYLASSRISGDSCDVPDSLNRSRLVAALATILCSDGDQHQTIGLFGPGGAGKSTLVQLLKKALIERRQQQPFLFAEFNARLYQQANSLAAGITQQVIAGLCSTSVQPAPGSSSNLGHLGQKVSGWLRRQAIRVALLCRYGYAFDGSLVTMRRAITALCKLRLKPVFGPKKRMLFVVEDLDRCSQQTVVEVLDAVHLLLSQPQVTVVIAADQRIVLAALATQYRQYSDQHQLGNVWAIARDQLAAVIHLPVSLTPGDDQAVTAFLRAVWSETEASGTSGGFLFCDSDQFGLEQRQQSTLGSGDVSHGLSGSQKNLFQHWVRYFNFNNPRQLKRLHNSYNLLRLFYGEDHSQVLPRLNLDLSAPFLISLFALEYVNSLNNAELRALLLLRIQQKQNLTFREDAPISEGKFELQSKINEEVLSVMLSKHEVSGMRYIEVVAPFVLPAIESIQSKPPASTQNQVAKENT